MNLFSNELEKAIVNNNLRPNVEEQWNKKLVNAMKKCWKKNYEKRPTALYLENFFSILQTTQISSSVDLPKVKMEDSQTNLVEIKELSQNNSIDEKPIELSSISTRSTDSNCSLFDESTDGFKLDFNSLDSPIEKKRKIQFIHENPSIKKSAKKILDNLIENNELHTFESNSVVQTNQWLFIIANSLL